MLLQRASICFIIVAIASAALFYLYIAHDYELVYIPTSSMAPNINPGSLALVRLDPEPTIGDVVLVSAYGTNLVHRVVWINQTAGTFGFRGDASNATSIMSFNNLKGTVIFALPMLGYIPMAIHEFPLLWMLGSGSIMLITLAIYLARSDLD